MLGGSQEAEALLTVAVEGEHGVDEVLEHAWPGDRPVLGDVPDQHEAETAPASERCQALRRGPHLRDRARARGRSCVEDRLDRVDDDHRGVVGLDRPLDEVEVGVAVEQQRVLERVHPLRAAPDLGDRLLCRHVEHGASLRTHRARPAAAWSSNVDLPTPGSPLTSVTEPGTSPPARTRSSSGMPTGTGSAPVTSTSGMGWVACTGWVWSCPGEEARARCSSTRVFHASHPAHRPPHLGDTTPHSVQRNWVVARDGMGPSCRLGETVLRHLRLGPARRSRERPLRGERSWECRTWLP